MSWNKSADQRRIRRLRKIFKAFDGVLALVQAARRGRLIKHVLRVR